MTAPPTCPKCGGLLDDRGNVYESDGGYLYSLRLQKCIGECHLTFVTGQRVFAGHRSDTKATNA